MLNILRLFDHQKGSEEFLARRFQMLSKAQPDAPVTMVDVLEEQFRLEQEAARELAQAKCTRTDLSGKLHAQQVFSCLTCLESTGIPIGLCKGCSTKCHGHHEVVDLGCKVFVCDCASKRGKCDGPSCPPKCELAPNGQEPCAANKYNHNFEGKFCVCKGPYEEDADTMYQCVGCEDWYHAEHIRGLPKSAGFTEHFDDFICALCTTRMPFLFGLLGTQLPEDGVVGTLQFGRQCLSCSVSAEQAATLAGAPAPLPVFACLACTAAKHESLGHTVGPVVATSYTCASCAVPDAAAAPAGSSGCVALASVASVDRSLLADGVSMFVPVSTWAHACACATCLANYEAFDVSHLRLRVAEPDSDSEDDDELEPCAPLAPLSAEVATTPSSVSGLSATPSSDAVATAMRGCSSPVVMCGLETAGLDALRSLPVPAQAAALSKFNSFSEQLRSFLKTFADSSKVVSPKDIGDFMAGMNSKKRPRSPSR